MLLSPRFRMALSRGSILFVSGNFAAVLLRFLQMERELLHLWVFRIDFMSDMLLNPWWYGPVFGLGAVLAGLSFPFLDEKNGKQSNFSNDRDWTSVFRCAVAFAGIHHAIAKFDSLSDSELGMTLLIISLFLWWTFDKSTHGLMLAVLFSFLGTSLTFVAENAKLRSTSYLYPKMWLPSLYFSGACLFGTLGRHLFLIPIDDEPVPKKLHLD